jgi:hypothetical protein
MSACRKISTIYYSTRYSTYLHVYYRAYLCRGHGLFSRPGYFIAQTFVARANCGTEVKIDTDEGQNKETDGEQTSPEEKRVARPSTVLYTGFDSNSIFEYAWKWSE